MSSPLAIGIAIVVVLVVILTLSKIIFIPLVNRYAPLGHAQAKREAGAELGNDSGKGQSAEKGFESLIGQAAEVVVALRPSGKVHIDGNLFEARSSLGFVDAGTPVKVIDVDGYFLVVDKAED